MEATTIANSLANATSSTQEPLFAADIDLAVNIVFTIKVAVKRWRTPQTTNRTYYIMMQSLFPTCFKTARAKKKEPR